MWDALTGYLKYLFSSYNPLAMIIELCMIAFVVYTVLRFLHGTGGEKLFRGVLFILLGVWAVGLVARKLHLDLERIQLLFKYFLGAVLVVAVIAFQPELRRGLMRLGGTRIGRGAATETEEVIEQLVDAVSFLSKTQIGAIIAIERGVGLGDLIAQGTRMNALVSSDLLNTIFWPGTPLHDMGVVIRRNRVAAAGVQFPLAEHGEFDRMLGSRHRAAIGLSKETDALVLVVSEETGQIGLAMDGKLTRYLTLEQLNHQLQTLLLPDTDKRQKRKILPSAPVKTTTPPTPQSPAKTGKKDAEEDEGDIVAETSHHAR